MIRFFMCFGTIDDSSIYYDVALHRELPVVVPDERAAVRAVVKKLVVLHVAKRTGVSIVVL
jgi:hypothetical protein